MSDNAGLATFGNLTMSEVGYVQLAAQLPLD